jgi:hypothetical protein
MFKTQESKIVSAPTWYLKLMLPYFLNDGLRNIFSETNPNGFQDIGRILVAYNQNFRQP